MANPSIPYNVERTKAKQDLPDEPTKENTSKEEEHTNTVENLPETEEKQEEPEEIKQPETKEVATFSTPLKSKANGRRNNIELTASFLEGCTIEPDSVFSFNETVGKPTSARGYQKADVLVDGKTIQAIGGGNCQVSTTIYNAALQVPDFEVLERHDHSKKVPYIAKGKDAAVSYGSLDLKIKNNGLCSYRLSVHLSENEITATFSTV